MTNTIRSKIERLADRRMWRYELGEIIWRGETADGNEIETADPIELLNEILEQLDNLPAVAWSIGHDENGNLIEYGAGGPFVNYSFYDETTRRIYMIDGMVFAPGFEKREFLRHVEIIARTFRLKSDGVNAAVETAP